MLSPDDSNAKYITGMNGKESSKASTSSPTSQVYLRTKPSSGFVRGQFDHPVPPTRPVSLTIYLYT